MSDDEIDLNIDDVWLRDFINEEKQYNQFYKEKPTSVKLIFLYTSSLFDVLQFIKKNVYTFKNEEHNTNRSSSSYSSLLSKDELLNIIKNNMYFNGREYSLVSLSKYNIDIDPRDIINDNLKHKTFHEYISYENINDITFNDTINLFKNINSLFFIFKDKIKLKHLNNPNPNPNNNYNKKSSIKSIFLNKKNNTNKKNKTKKNVTFSLA